MQEARVIASQQQGGSRPADHGHQRVQRHQTTDARQALGAHHVEAEPADDQDPGTQRQEGNVRGWKGDQSAFAIAALARAQQHHRGQRQPATHRMHHHGAGEVMETCAEQALEVVLQPQVVVPHQALEAGIDEGHDQRGGAQLWYEARPLGDAAGDDRRNGRGEGRQEKELHQSIATVGAQHLGRSEEGHAIGDPVADEEVHQGGNGEVGEDLGQGIHLVLVPHGTGFEKGEAGVHGQHHHGAEQEEEGIGTVDQGRHGRRQFVHQGSRLKGLHQKHAWRLLGARFWGAQQLSAGSVLPPGETQRGFDAGMRQGSAKRKGVHH